MQFDSFPGAGFHVVLEGTCRLLPVSGDPIVLNAGDVVCLPHGHGHGLAASAATNAEAGTKLLCGGYLLDRGRLHPLLAELPDVIHVPAGPGHVGSGGPPEHPELHNAVELLGGELQTSGPGTDAVIPALLDVLLLFILRAWHREQQHVGGWAAALGDPDVSTALRAMHESPEKPWTVRDLAAVAGMSRAPFAKRFAALVGRPPLAYLTWWRMTTAARLLRDTDATLRTIAARTGYTSEFAFSKAFRKEFGIAPGAYRRQRT